MSAKRSKVAGPLMTTSVSFQRSSGATFVAGTGCLRTSAILNKWPVSLVQLSIIAFKV